MYGFMFLLQAKAKGQSRSSFSPTPSESRSATNGGFEGRANPSRNHSPTETSAGKYGSSTTNPPSTTEHTRLPSAIPSSEDTGPDIWSEKTALVMDNLYTTMMLLC